MSIYELIYLIVIMLGFLFGICLVAYKSCIQSRIQKRYLSKDQRIEYIKQLEQFKLEHNIYTTDSVIEIANKAGLSIEQCARKDMESGYDGRIINNKIIVIKDLTIRQKNAIIAHEIAHYLRKQEQNLIEGCKTKTMFVRKEEEQICDYIAAAILLPIEELKIRMEEADYDHRKESLRVEFINEIADEKNIPISVVLQRLKDVKENLHF